MRGRTPEEGPSTGGYQSCLEKWAWSPYGRHGWGRIRVPWAGWRFCWRPQEICDEDLWVLPVWLQTRALSPLPGGGNCNEAPVASWTGLTSRQARGLQGSGVSTFMSFLSRMWHCLPHPSPIHSFSQLLLRQSVSIQGDRHGRVSDCCVPTLHLLSHLIAHCIDLRDR